MSGFARRLQQGASVRQAIAGNILAKDDFNRADGSLGSSDSGTGYSSQPWSTFGTPISGSTPTWGIVNDQVYVTAPGGTNSEAIATIPVSVLAGTAFCDIYLSPTSSCAALSMRASSDGSTYLNIQLNESEGNYDRIALSKRVAGVTTWLAAIEPANLGAGFGYTLATVLTASEISVYVEGVFQFS
ncbi:MAG TPA: hypothetical protein VHD60_04815, partial [Candidatus Saccharimonadales bacterium]|nr:hypothetical protein [Candidatus Saccharimonadales bacterium]